MFNISDQECPVCREPKMKIIVSSGLDESTQTRSEYWWYSPSDNEVVVEGYCSGCGIKFIVDI